MPGYITENELTEKLKDDIKKSTSDKISLSSPVGNISTNVQDSLEDHEKRIKEAFQYANNGKTNIASVVGSPAASNNTFAQLKSYIQTDKNTLATNLTNKGVDAKGSETLEALVKKVGNIQSRKEVIENGLNITVNPSYIDKNSLCSATRTSINNDNFILSAEDNPSPPKKYSFRSASFATYYESEYSDPYLVCDKVALAIMNGSVLYSPSTKCIKINADVAVNFSYQVNSDSNRSYIKLVNAWLVFNLTDGIIYVYRNESDINIHDFESRNLRDSNSFATIYNNHYYAESIMLYIKQLKTYYRIKVARERLIYQGEYGTESNAGVKICPILDSNLILFICRTYDKHGYYISVYPYSVTIS